jgi:hypothetical protein
MWAIFYTNVLMVPGNRALDRESCEKLFMECARDKKGTKGFKKSSATPSLKRGCFQIFWDECLSPDLPFEIIDTDAGLGIFVKRVIRWDHLSAVLNGHIIFFGPEQFLSLRKLGISNLYQDCDNVLTAREPFCGVMYGPLSLVNHRCNALFQFGKPGTVVDPVTNTSRGIIKLKYTGNAQTTPRITAGQEFTIKYAEWKSQDSMGFDCLCSDSCVRSHAKRPRVEQDS